MHHVLLRLDGSASFPGKVPLAEEMRKSMPDEAATSPVAPAVHIRNEHNLISSSVTKKLRWHPATRTLAAATFVIAHTAITALFIICMYGIEELIKHLWASEAPLLFGIVPLSYVFHAIDLGVLGAFGYRGILSAYQAFEE